MNPAKPVEKDVARRKARLYFILAISFLFLLALLWSIDSSFIYILLGSCLICTYFGVLNYRHYTRNISDSEKFYHRRDDTVNNPYQYQRPAQPPPVQSSKLKILHYAVIGFSALFFFFIVVGIFTESDNDTARDFYAQAEMLYSNGEYDSALLYYRAALRKDEDHESAILGYGNTLLAKEQYDSAVIMYDRLILNNPDYEQAYYQKGLTLYYAKQYPASIETMEALLERNSIYTEAMQVIGDDYYNQQQYDSALVWYEQAYAANVRNRYLCHLMGYIYETKGNKTKAIALYKEALEYEDDVLDIYQRLAAFYPGADGDAYRKKVAELQPKN